MKRIIFLCIALCIFITGCQPYQNNKETKEQPHLYWKDIDVVVTDIDRMQWFVVTTHFKLKITVYSKEYDLEKTFYYDGSGLFGEPSQWDYEIGSTVKAELFSWVLDSTGSVVRREINQVY